MIFFSIFFTVSAKEHHPHWTGSEQNNYCMQYTHSLSGLGRVMSMVSIAVIEEGGKSFGDLFFGTAPHNKIDRSGHTPAPAHAPAHAHAHTRHTHLPQHSTSFVARRVISCVQQARSSAADRSAGGWRRAPCHNEASKRRRR